MRLAVIDCGSNSFRLLIAEKLEDSIKIINRDAHMVRLGRELKAHSSVISESTYLRCIKIFNLFKELVQAFNCQKVLCIGTSALRSAQNAQSFISKIYKRTGFRIHIISGELESHLSFLGAVGSETKVSRGCAVLDIGGGSTECSISTDTGIFSYSTELGAVRLTNMFWPHKDVPSLREQQRLRRYIRSTWEDAFKGKHPFVQHVIGVAGTITNLAAIALQMETFDSALIEGKVLTCSEIEQMKGRLCEATLDKRKLITGLQPERADIIIAGTIVLLETMHWLQVTEINVSDQDLMQAIVYQHELFQDQWQPVSTL